jgi:glutathione S-transferase
MPLTVLDVLAPVGRIEPDLFPAEQEEDGTPKDALLDRLNAYLDEAVARTADLDDPDEAAKHWVYYRAFTAAAVRLAALPSNVSQNDTGGHAYSSDQRKMLERWASEALAAFRTLSTTVHIAGSAETRSVTNNFDW